MPSKLIQYVDVEARTLAISIENFESRNEQVRFILPELIRSMPTGSYSQVETYTVITEVIE